MSNETFSFRILRLVDIAIDILFLCVFALVLAFTLYGQWDNEMIENTASSEQWLEYKPQINDFGSFDEMRMRNPDTVAWLELYGTNIDYPVMYSKEHNKYLSHNPLGEYSLSGALFLDPGCAPDFSDLQTIIYGHHMDKELLFGSLDCFADEGYFLEHQYGRIAFNGAIHGLETWALLETEAYDSDVYSTGINDPEKNNEYLELLGKKASLVRDSCSFDADDKILLMSTCAGITTNGRTVLVGKILDWIPEDPYEKNNSGTGIDSFSNLTTDIVVLVLLVTILLVVSLVYARARKKRKKWAEESEAADEIELGNHNQKPLSGEIPAYKNGMRTYIIVKLVLAAVVLLVSFTMLLGASQVNNSYMYPMISKGDFIVVNKLDREFHIGDVVQVKNEQVDSLYRIVAQGGDQVDVSDGNVLINGNVQYEQDIFFKTEQEVAGTTFPISVPPGEYFVLADHREDAVDSRVFGCVKAGDLKGKLMIMIKNVF